MKVRGIVACQEKKSDRLFLMLARNRSELFIGRHSKGMMDRLTVERRSQLMARIRSKDTKPELVVRSTLHKLGYRYVLHKKGLPGTPDLTFPARKKIVFVHGCYWHGHTCKQGLAQSKSNVEFWTSKIEANRKRDRRNVRRLRRAGWQVAVVWECQIKKNWLSRIVRFLER